MHITREEKPLRKHSYAAFISIALDHGDKVPLKSHLIIH